jgi:hypothetical protein
MSFIIEFSFAILLLRASESSGPTYIFLGLVIQRHVKPTLMLHKYVNFE